MQSELAPVFQPKRPSTLTLLLIALPLGVLFNRSVGGWDNLPAALMTAFGWLDEPTLLHRHTVRVTANLLIPCLMMFIALAATPLGAWLVPNRLALGALLIADSLLVFVALRGLVLAAMNEPPFMTGLASDISGWISIWSFAVGMASLMLSTLWHRLIKNQSRARGLCSALLRSV